MANVRHSQLTGSNLHEPKGVAAAADNTIAQASSGAVSWSDEISPSKLTLTDTVWNDVKADITAVSLAGVSDPGFTQLVDDGGGSTGVFTYKFDPAIEEEVFFEVQLPHGYKAATALKAHVHWCPTTTNTGDVVWGLEYSNSNVGDTIGASTIITVTDAADGTSLKHQVAGFSDISGTGIAESEVFLCRFFRDATNVADTYTGDAAVLSIDFHIELEKIGSDNEFPS